MLIDQLKNSFFDILILIGIIILARILTSILLDRLYNKYLKNSLKKKSRIQKRLHTLIEVENNLALTLGFIIALFLIIKNFVNITPVVAGAGILTLAVSLGAQSLFKDLITGVFFLAQDQFGVGDTVQVNNLLTGIITDITLRTVTIRDFSGNTTTFPNGSIIQITNLTKEWSMFSFTFVTAITNPIDPIIDAMKKAGEYIEQDEQIHPFLVDKMNFLGIDSMGDGKMGIMISIKTQPGRQFEIGRTYKYKLKKLLEEKNISI